MAGIQATTSLIGQWSGTGQQFYEDPRYPQRSSSRLIAGRFHREDRVELSPNAPRPLDARILQRAAAVADSLEISPETTEKLRQDRIYAVVGVLAAIARQGAEPQWAGGLPAPTKAELAAAYRRIHQRLSRMDTVRNPESMSTIRSEIIESDAVKAAIA